MGDELNTTICAMQVETVVIALEENGTMEPNAEDGIYNELVNLINLDEFNGGASAIGSMPAVYMFDEPLDLDVVTTFHVGLTSKTGDLHYDQPELYS
ncbi:hypothetical protein Tco_1061127 [Tanacetum coccineum]